jgi:hypothetical protein
MIFNPDDPAPPGREYPVRNEESGSYGALGIIIVMGALAIGAYYLLGNRPASVAIMAPNQIETTGSAPASVSPQPSGPTLGRDCIQTSDPQACN